MNKITLKEWINNILSDDLYVENVIVTIYKNQTDDEQEEEKVYHNNGIGFRINHVKKGSKLAKIILSGKRLSNIELIEARLISLHYYKQYTNSTFGVL